MAFPTTGILDDFNRASIGSNWTTGNTFGDGATAWTTSGSTQAAPSSEYTDGTYTVADYGPDCEAYVTIGTDVPQDRFHSLFLRLTGAGTANCDGYVCERQPRPGSSNVRFYRVDNKVWTQIGTTASVAAFAAGNQFGFEIVGSTLTCYRGVSGTWTSLASVTDTTYTAAGRIGMGQFANANTQLRLDDLGGGTVSGGGGGTTTVTSVVATATAAGVAPGPSVLTPSVVAASTADGLVPLSRVLAPSVAAASTAGGLSPSVAIASPVTAASAAGAANAPTMGSDVTVSSVTAAAVTAGLVPSPSVLVPVSAAFALAEALIPTNFLPEASPNQRIDRHRPQDQPNAVAVGRRR